MSFGAFNELFNIFYDKWDLVFLHKNLQLT